MYGVLHIVVGMYAYGFETINLIDMKLRIELEIDLGDNFINPNDKEERDWLFNHILTESNLFLHDNEIGDTIGDVKKVIKCEEVK